MIGASVGDLVQFVKTSAGRGNGKRGVPTKEAPAAVTATSADDVLVSRVELDCRTYRHRQHWEQVVLPRLYEFARMVYRFRGDDLLRWRYLLATPVRFVVGSEWCARLMRCAPFLGCAFIVQWRLEVEMVQISVCVGLRTCCTHRYAFHTRVSCAIPRLPPPSGCLCLCWIVEGLFMFL